LINKNLDEIRIIDFGVAKRMKIYNEDYIIEGGMEEKEFDFNNK